MKTCAFGSEDVELYFYGELDGAAADRVRTHVLSCADCRRHLDALRAIRAALADDPPVSAPPAGDWSGFMRRLDAAVAADSRQAANRRWHGVASYLAIAATLALATLGVVTASRARQAHLAGAAVPTATHVTAAGPQFVSDPVRSLVQHSEEHLERSKLVVLGLATRDPHDARPGDWAYERELAGSLLPDTRLYRLAAENRGMTRLARVMGDLETLLLETSMSDVKDPQALARLQRLITRRDLVVKMQVVESAGI